MAGSVSGSVSLSASFSELFAVAANVLAQYQIPAALAPSLTYADGTGASQAHKFAMASGTLASTTISFDLTNTATNMTMSDSTTSFSHVRELIIVNTDTTATHYLYFDTSVANTFGTGTSGSAFIEGTMTTVKQVVQPGPNWFRWAKPLGTNGVTVDSTHKLVTLDSGSNSITYQVLVVGD